MHNTLGVSPILGLVLLAPAGFAFSWIVYGLLMRPLVRRSKGGAALEIDSILATFGLLFDRNLDGTAFLELAEQHLFRQRLLDVLLDHAAERSCAHTFVIPLLCEPGDGILRQIEGDVAFGKLCLELHDELLHDLMHHWRRQSAKRNDGIQAVTELRREQPVDRLHIVAFALR